MGEVGRGGRRYVVVVSTFRFPDSVGGELRRTDSVTESSAEGRTDNQEGAMN